MTAHDPEDRTVQLLNLHSPAGTAWELFVVVVVIIAAPVIVERVRIPGLIGLLAGGCIIGPQVLGVVSDTSGHPARAGRGRACST